MDPRDTRLSRTEETPMAGNSARRGAVRKSKKGATVGSGGVRRRALEGRGPRSEERRVGKEGSWRLVQQRDVRDSRRMGKEGAGGVHGRLAYVAKGGHCSE